MANSTGHAWSFFVAGGVEQVSLRSAADLAALDQLDQKLWVALACPTSGLHFDKRTLELVDADGDGRIRAPEVLAAVKWASGLLKQPGQLLDPGDALALDAIDDSGEEGQAVLAAAKRVLLNQGKGDANAISVDDVADTAKNFADALFNGDGVIAAAAAGDDAGLATTIEEIVDCVGSAAGADAPPGIGQEQLDAFFAAAAAHAAWWNRGAEDAAIRVLGDGTAAAATAVEALRAKVEDYFARCRLAAFDNRALAALNHEESEYLALAAKDLSISVEEIAGFPLARIEAGRPLPLRTGVNPAWEAALAELASAAVAPLIGETATLTLEQWRALDGKLAPYRAWQAEKAGAEVERLGVERLGELLAGDARARLGELLAQDKALEPEARALASVEKLVRLHRNLRTLLDNFVSFRDFFAHRDKAIFQAGTLYLDRRSCDLCIRVPDVAKHAALAGASRNLLAYCDLTRKGSSEKMSIVAAFTGGDADYLFVGRNGVFYDREGKDWDATIVKLVDAPVSIRQAIWSPYKKFLKLVEAQIEKIAASKDKALQDQATASVTDAGKAVETAAATPPAAAAAAKKREPFDVAKFAGIFAAIGLAIGAIGGALGAMLGAFAGLAWWQMPLALLGIMLLISGPSVVIAWIKLRQRNIGPLLDACGWAINARVKINLPFGGTLTHVAALPRGARLSTADPYKAKRTGRRLLFALLVLLAALAGLWYFGAVERYFPGLLPPSPRAARPAVEAPAPPASGAAAPAKAPAAKP